MRGWRWPRCSRPTGCTSKRLARRRLTGETTARPRCGGEGKNYPGKHEPMVTVDEFDRVHEFLDDSVSSPGTGHPYVDAGD
jgi:hypothetical protein